LEDRCVPAAFNVNSLADILSPQNGVVTLRSAIQAANATPDPTGNTINLTVAGTYRLTIPGANSGNNTTGGLTILPTANLTITNTSGGTVAVDGGGLDRVFDINPADTNNPLTHFTVTFNGFTIEDGAARSTTGNPDGPDASGGGIRDQGNISLTLNNVVVTNNTATADGGGVSMENVASTPWTLTVNNSVISNNHAGDAGGGLETDGSGKVFVNSGTVISGNTSVNQGAGIWLDAITVGTVDQGANLTINGATIANNTAFAADNDGGGVGNAGNGTVTIENSTIANNYVNGIGGGFGDENNQGTLIVVDSTFVGNTAIGNGGGIQEGGASTTINDSTFTANASQGMGGGLSVQSAAFTLNNTIVAGNFADNGGMNFVGPAPDVLAAITSGTGDFIGIGDANLTGITNGTAFNRIGTAAAPLDPLLGPLQNNGGPTQTEAPLPGSPVLDAGVNSVVPAGLTTDQRGAARVVNVTVDIGAVEDPVGSLVGGTFFTDAKNQLWLFRNGVSINTGGFAKLFSGGVDAAGNPEVFFTDGINQLWRWDNGTFTNTGAFATRLSAGDGVVAFTDGLNELFTFSDASGVHNSGAFASHISTGFDATGVNQVAFTDGNGQIWTLNPATGALGNTGIIAIAISEGRDAAGHNQIYYQDSTDHIFRLDQGQNINTGVVALAGQIAGSQGQVYFLSAGNHLEVLDDATGLHDSGGFATQISSSSGTRSVFFRDAMNELFRFQTSAFTNTGAFAESVSAF
jgi:hypothetical protein